jgi:hypothetical protein
MFSFSPKSAVKALAPVIDDNHPVIAQMLGHGAVNERGRNPPKTDAL